MAVSNTPSVDGERHIDETITWHLAVLFGALVILTVVFERGMHAINTCVCGLTRQRQLLSFCVCKNIFPPGCKGCGQYEISTVFYYHLVYCIARPTFAQLVRFSALGFTCTNVCRCLQLHSSSNILRYTRLRYCVGPVKRLR
jgi:hypothetical protein